MPIAITYGVHERACAHKSMQVSMGDSVAAAVWLAWGGGGVHSLCVTAGLYTGIPYNILPVYIIYYRIYKT